MIALLFPTVEFLGFFFVVFYGSWVLNERPLARKIFLLFASYVFYSYWDAKFLVLLIATSLANYLVGLGISSSIRYKKSWLSLGIITNLAVLMAFKYWGFFAASFLDILGQWGFQRELAIWEFVLPMGISFFIFQGMSYIIDVYRGSILVRRNVIDMLLYISFFPQLVAGPIVRAKDFLPQLDHPSDPNQIDMAKGFWLIGIGLFKKVIIAHYLAVLVVDPVFAAPYGFHPLDVLLAAYGYAVQIYCDFSAYSDMAIGIAALLGFSFQKNFDQPYRSASVSEFWRRWHISLSSWLKDYLYIPLGGNRKGRILTLRNLMMTMVLGGLWHGAAWHFVFWGFLHGFCLCLEKTYLIGMNASRGAAKVVTDSLLRRYRWLKIAATFHFVCFTWIFFRSSGLDEAWQFLGALVPWAEQSRSLNIELWSGFSALLVLLGLCGQFVPENLVIKLETGLIAKGPAWSQGAVLGFVIALIAAMGPGALAPFIYFQF